MADRVVRTPDEELRLRMAARMMVVTAVIFVAAGAVWLISGTNVFIGLAFVAVGLVTVALARLLRSRIGPSAGQP